MPTKQDLDKLKQISDILGISLDYLLKGEPSSNTIPRSIIKAYHCCPENKKKHFEKAIKNIAKLITIE